MSLSQSPILYYIHLTHKLTLLYENQGAFTPRSNNIFSIDDWIRLNFTWLNWAPVYFDIKLSSVFSLSLFNGVSDRKKGHQTFSEKHRNLLTCIHRRSQVFLSRLTPRGRLISDPKVDHWERLGAGQLVLQWGEPHLREDNSFFCEQILWSVKCVALDFLEQQQLELCRNPPHKCRDLHAHNTVYFCVASLLYGRQEPNSQMHVANVTPLPLHRLWLTPVNHPSQSQWLANT